MAVIASKMKQSSPAVLHGLGVEHALATDPSSPKLDCFILLAMTEGARVKSKHLFCIVA
jgi:hypothetical protein